jgi:hypothetical protein
MQDISVTVNRTECPDTTGLKIAIPRSAIEPLVGMNFVVNVLGTGGPVESLGDPNMGLTMGGDEDMMFMDEHPCFSYDWTNETACVNNTENITGAEECIWDDFMQLCNPDFKNMNCTDFCGACGTAADCLSEGVKGACMVVDAPHDIPPDAITWDDGGEKMCVEDPDKFIFGLGGNCDDNCYDCYTEQMCNNSNVPHPTEGASQAGCKWFTDQVFGDSWCDISTYAIPECNSSNCDWCFTNAACSGAGGDCVWDADFSLRRSASTESMMRVTEI